MISSGSSSGTTASFSAAGWARWCSRTKRTRSRFDCRAGWSSAAGQTIRQVRRVQQNGKPAVKVDYEITISTTLLYNTFQNVERTVTVGGLVCRDRLESLQRIFEHELLHLAEFLGWGRSNCRADNFHALSRRIFRPRRGLSRPDHASRTGPGGLQHSRRRPCQLRAGRSAARRARQSDHASGDRSGRKPGGKLYTDGKRYVPFYVPLPLLRKESQAS